MNTNRNPKSLRDFVEKSKLENEEIIAINPRNDFEESLKNLKNLSNEEKTEVGLLKSRIDEQSRLIMILKQRGDDFIRKNLSLEKLNQELIEKKDELEQECKLVNDKYKTLLDRFDYLANNHEELIKIKDEYKEKNLDLSQKYQNLVAKLNNLPSEDIIQNEKNLLSLKIEELSKTCHDFENKYFTLKQENEDYLIKLKQAILKTEQKEFEITSLNLTIEEIKQKNQHLLDDYNKLKEESNKINEKNVNQINQLNKDNQELNLLCENLKKEKKSLFENHQILEKNYKSISQELIKLKDNYQKNSVHKELEEANKKYNDLEKQFDAYKIHTNSLIEKEKELNRQLRFLVS